VLPIQDVESSYYLRMRVLDRPGVLADITRVLADCRISIEAMVQKEPAEGESQVDIVMLTHRALERHVEQATVRIERLDTVAGHIVRLRREDLL
jgi:homoserine dehydrogenase